MKKLIGITLLAFVMLLTGCDNTSGDTPNDDKKTPDVVRDLVVKEVNDVTIELGSSIDVLPACSLKESSGTNVECLLKGDTLNLNKVGTYNVIYYGKNDENSATNEITFTVTVEDTTAPIINMVSKFTIEVGDTNYVLPTCTVTEASDPDMKCNMTGTHNINPNKVGNTTIHITAIDESDNLAKQVNLVVSVVDTVDPVITLEHDTFVMNQGETIDLSEGVTATDNYDDDITNQIDAGSIDTSGLDAGEYPITYTVVDSSGNIATATATLIVNEVLYTIGDTVTFDGFDIFVKRVEVVEVENDFSSSDKAVAVTVELKNSTTGIHFLNLFYHSMTDQHDEDLSDMFVYFDDSISQQGSMLPNAVMEGKIVYEYTGDGSYRLKLSSLTETVNLGFNVVDGVVEETSVTSPLTSYVEHSAVSNEAKPFGEPVMIDTMLVNFLQADVKEIDNMFADYDKAVVLDVEIANNGTDIDSLLNYEFKMFDPSGLELVDQSTYFEEDYTSKGDIIPWANMSATMAFNYTTDGTYTIVFYDGSNELLVRQFTVVDGTVTSSNSVFNVGVFTGNRSFVSNNTVPVGTVIIFDGFELTINSASIQDNDGLFDMSDQAVVFDVTVKNTTDEVNAINVFYHSCFGSKGIQVNNAFWNFETLDSEDINPGETVTGTLAYEYDGNGTYILRFVDIEGSYELVNVVVE